VHAVIGQAGQEIPLFDNRATPNLPRIDSGPAQHRQRAIEEDWGGAGDIGPLGGMP
jgi:hypothetical protein